MVMATANDQSGGDGGRGQAPGPLVTLDGMAGRLADAQGDVARTRRELREAVDARDALVFEATDHWHMSGRATARALADGNEGGGFTPAGVHKILANGPPPEPDTGGHEAIPT
jgi:hypothetical protein